MLLHTLTQSFLVSNNISNKIFLFSLINCQNSFLSYHRNFLTNFFLSVNFFLCVFMCLCVCSRERRVSSSSSHHITFNSSTSHSGQRHLLFHHTVKLYHRLPVVSTKYLWFLSFYWNVSFVTSLNCTIYFSYKV